MSRLAPSPSASTGLPLRPGFSRRQDRRLVKAASALRRTSRSFRKPLFRYEFLREHCIVRQRDGAVAAFRLVDPSTLRIDHEFAGISAPTTAYEHRLYLDNTLDFQYKFITPDGVK